MWADLDDRDPDITKHTESLTRACLNFRVPEYIDHIVTDTQRTALVRPGSVEQVLFTAVGGGDQLSDHCTIAVVFETDGEIETSDAITDLLDRLDAVQAELQEIRDAVASAGVGADARRGARKTVSPAAQRAQLESFTSPVAYLDGVDFAMTMMRQGLARDCRRLLSNPAHQVSYNLPR